MRRQAIPRLEHREQSAAEQALGWALRVFCDLARPTMRRVLVFAYTLAAGVLVGLTLVGLFRLTGHWSP